MVVIFSAPAAPPTFSDGLFFNVKHEWIGHDGSQWTLSDWESGVCLLKNGVQGLHYPRVEKFASRSRAIPGRRIRGWRATARDVAWRVHVWTDSSQEWLDLNDAFFNSFHPEREGTWRVTSASGVVRELRLTGAFNDDFVYEADPVFRGWASYPIALEAAQPYWSGAPIIRSWQSGAGVPFIPVSLGPSFFVSSSRTFASASITNPGDVEAYPVWTITGPLTDIAIGVGGVLIEVDTALVGGDVLVIDTDPRNLTATLNGVDFSETLGFQRYAPVPAKGVTSLDVAATGDGSVAVSLTPLYFRAF